LRLVFLIPDITDKLPRPQRQLVSLLRRLKLTRLENTLFQPLLVARSLRSPVASGGALNIMRHAAIASSLGAEAVLATPSGVDTYGSLSVVNLPFIRWADRRDDDICMVPDICTHLIDDVRGRAIAYLQVPTHVRADFDYLHPRVRLWTDSPFMLEICNNVYAEKHVAIVPNVVDNKAFPFRSQSERKSGLLLAFPRKGPEFIEATRVAYANLGGTYWKFDLVGGLSLKELANRMQQHQAFLASAEVEGCALPPRSAWRRASSSWARAPAARTSPWSTERRR
jgi:hypothetical protein